MAVRRSGGEGRLKNEFSWSFSRHNTFEECEKKYWYTYYGSWEGWYMYQKGGHAKADMLAGYLYALKQMKSIPMFVGTVVHETIEHALKAYRVDKSLISLDDMLAHGEEGLMKGIAEAVGGLWKASPKNHNNLIETYYNEEEKVFTLSDEAKKVSVEKMQRCIIHWYTSPIAQKTIVHPRSSFLGIEELDSFYLDDLYKVWVVIDCALRWKRDEKEDSVILFDWKTGKENDRTLEQLYSYALFADKAWGIGPERVVLVPFYLDGNTYEKIGAGQCEGIVPEKMVETEHFIRMSSEIMSKKLIGERDDRKGLIKKNCVDIMDFPYTNDRRSCRRCPYRQLCEGVEYEEVPEIALREKAAFFVKGWNV